MKKPRKRASLQARTPLQTLLQDAEQAFIQGEHQQALLLARHCLGIEPHNPALLNFAGVCAITLGDQREAEAFWRRSAEIDPSNPTTHFNLGLLLSKRHQTAEAIQCYRRVLSLAPDNAPAYCNLGNLLGDSADAESCYRAATALDPAFEAAHYNLGNLLLQRDAWEDAAHCYRQALAAHPADPSTHAKLGLALAKHGDFDAAEQAYRLSIALDPGCLEAHANLGLLLEDKQMPEEAERCLRRALEICPDSPETCSNLGNLLAQQDRVDEAEQCYRQALLLNPASASAYCNLGVLLATHKPDAGEAETCFRQALVCNPTHALTRFNLGQLLLRAGRLEEGWAYHEARYARNIPNQRTFLPDIPTPQWQGEPLAGKSLLVLSEQGFGDAIQFCRYLALLKEQGATHLTLKCRTELKALFATLDGADEVGDGAAADFPPHDYWVFLHSIPLHCKTTLNNIPARIPYLHAPPERREHWASRLPGGGLRVGLVWKGNRMHSNDARRSLPGLAALRPLWAAPGVVFISLQKGQGEEEAAHPGAQQPLLDLGVEAVDFADTAAIVEQLDLVICVDTAVAHLAGALGKPCWLMLSDHKTDWRWLRGRSDTPWYPTLRLFRQTTRDDWESVIGAVCDELTALSAKTQP